MNKVIKSMQLNAALAKLRARINQAVTSITALSSRVDNAEDVLDIIGSTSGAANYSGTAPSGTVTNFATYNFTPGTYACFFGCTWGTNGTGYRRVSLANAIDSMSTSRDRSQTVMPHASINLVQNASCLLILTSNTTLYLNVLQNSGVSLSASPYCRIVRIK